MPTLVFVYGTLKRGFPNAGRIRGQRLEGVFRTVQAWPLYVVRLPGEDRAPWLLDRPGEGLPVFGELLAVDDDELRAMDDFEEVGRPGGYRRRALELQSAAGPAQRLQAEAYLKPAAELAGVLAKEGPFEAYTPALARGYWLK